MARAHPKQTNLRDILKLGRRIAPPARVVMPGAPTRKSRALHFAHVWYPVRAMLLPMILLPLLVGGAAALLLTATWGANALAGRLARWHAARPRFTSAERARLRSLRERYRRAERR